MNENARTISDIMAEFYDLQRQQANKFAELVAELVALNQKVPKPEPKPEAS
jgi:hypothetical protein